MEDRKLKFLQAVLGDDGARALRKAAERSAELGNALLPRTIFGWLKFESEYDFEGELPGLENTYVAFSKTEGGFSGCVAMGEDLYKFENATLFHVAASVAVAVGLDGEHISPALRDVDLERLGKSIDLLAKARRVSKEIEDSKKKELEKGFEGPGKTAEAKAPAGPTPPTPTAPKPPSAGGKKGGGMKLPKAPKPVASSTIKLNRSEARRPCSACGLPQMRDTALVGCVCFRELCKSAKVVGRDADGILIELGSEWDRESVVTFLEAVGRK